MRTQRRVSAACLPYILYGESNFRIDRASFTCTLSIKTPVSNVFRVDFRRISRGEHGDRAGLGATADNTGFTEYIARPRARKNRLCANGIENAEGCDIAIPLKRKITQHESKSGVTRMSFDAPGCAVTF